MSFDLHKIEAFKSVMIQKNFTATNNTWSQNVQIPFIPDFVIVKNVNYEPTIADTAASYLIVSDTLSPGVPIANFSVYDANATPTVAVSNPAESSLFMLRKPVTGDLPFTITSTLAGTINALNGSISFQLEFIKMMVLPEQKVY